MTDVDIEDDTTQEGPSSSSELASAETSSAQKVFLNPTTRDTLLSDLVNGSYNASAINGNKSVTREENAGRAETTQPEAKPSMAVATREQAAPPCNRMNSA